MGKVRKKPDKSLQGKKPVNKANVGKPIISKNKSKDGASSSASSASKPQVQQQLKNPSHITNKLKRSEMYGKYLQQKRQQKKVLRLQREKESEALGNNEHDNDSDDGDNGTSNTNGPPTITPKAKAVPRTLDTLREVEPTLVLQDPEVFADEIDDEFAPYLNPPTLPPPPTTAATATTVNPAEEEDDDEEPKSSSKSNSSSIQPKVMITTRPRPSRHLFWFIHDLQQLIPGLEFYPRKTFSVKEICQFATKRNYTHLIVLSEHEKKCSGMTISHLGASSTTTSNSEEEPLIGPTAYFKVSNVITSQNIPNRGSSTSHIPELNLHGFGTRLGHRVGRLLASLFPHDQIQLEGRQIVTFHNQRDYIFVRHHRYIFDPKSERLRAIESRNREKESSGKSKSKDMTPQEKHEQHIKQTIGTNLQELGPRFTLKLRWVQEGTFDTQFGEYEWIHKRKEMDITRRKFHL